MRRHLQPSFSRVEDLIKTEIHRTMYASTQNGYHFTSHVADRLARQISERLNCSGDNLGGSQPQRSELSLVESGVTREGLQKKIQVPIRASCLKNAITRHTFCRTFSCVLGTLTACRYHSHVPISKSDESLFVERQRTEFRFTLARWLRWLLRRGTFVWQIEHKPQCFTFHISTPRVVDTDDVQHKYIWEAVRHGNLHIVQTALQSRSAYPSDVNSEGFSLLHV